MQNPLNHPNIQQYVSKAHHHVTHISRPLKWTLISLAGLLVLGAGALVGYKIYKDITERDVLAELESMNAAGSTVVNCLSADDYTLPSFANEEAIKEAWENFRLLRENCAYTTTDFGVIEYFDPESNFQSSLTLDFSLPFYRILETPGTPEYAERINEYKNILIKNLRFSPAVKLETIDIGVYDKKVVLSVILEPKTKYTLTLDAAMMSLENKRIEPWEFETPENTTFLLRTRDRVTLYNTDHPPILEVVSYNSGKTETKIQVCPVTLENYGKIEVFLKNHDISRDLSDKTSAESLSKNLTPQEDFFYQGIESLLDTTKCGYIPQTLSQSDSPLVRVDIPLDGVINEMSKTGLYVAIFSNKEDRHFNTRVQPPILIGSIDAHTTMKVGQNGDAFFFVNGFAGMPVAGMEITASMNDFASQSVQYSPEGRRITPISPLKNSVYSKPIVLGKTDKNGILQVNLRDKIDNYYGRSFENIYEFDEMGKYTSFFIVGRKGESFSVVSSLWNGGIAPWNFGYKVNSWYDSSGLNTDNLNLTQWNPGEWLTVGHLFADRVLYLPGETVSLKAVMRNAHDLSVPKGKPYTLIIHDSQGKEVKRSSLVANEFGSILDTFVLPRETPLGSYSVVVNDTTDREFARTAFTVEVFKNPKFRTEIQLTSKGLSGEEVKITKQDRKQFHYYYYDTVYGGEFQLEAQLVGRYYNGGVLSGATFDYKVYRQEYYDTSYWNDCYYGCFWEPQKEFYTEGNGTFDQNGAAKLSIPVQFESSYSDYRYILEVTPRDAAGDVVSSTNSVIAKLPEEYKNWNPNSTLQFSTEKRFYPAGTKVALTGKLNYGTWSEYQNNKYLLLIKKKDFKTQEILDVRGYLRPVTTQSERLVDVFTVNDSDFVVKPDGSITLDYTFAEDGEYVVQFGKINTVQFAKTNIDVVDLIREFSKSGATSLEKNVSIETDPTTDFWGISSRCIGDETVCSRDAIVRSTGCDIISNEVCLRENHTIKMKQRISVDDLLVGKQFLSLITYSNRDAANPVVSDNKIHVLSEKVSYKIGETARILVRLPFSKGKVLYTVEKKGVEKSELVDVANNVFFREVLVDESFQPNAYIGVLAIDTGSDKVPEYKVGYTEIVVDKTDKKSNVTIQSDKTTYSPREKVTLNLQVKNGDGSTTKNEVAVMVIDDSLISLMGNIDMNTLEKIWIKLAFQIQTSITNIAMLKNYYFSRPGIVGGSGALDKKGGDSEESTRTIFKNTAYYNGRVITDGNGLATVSFSLPDNLTQFRVIAIAQNTRNNFGAGEHLFSVKKPVIIEDKTPLIIRDGDRALLGANVFNQTGKKMDFSVSLAAPGLSIKNPLQKISLNDGENAYVEFDTSILRNGENITYTLKAKGDSTKNSDSLSNTIIYKSSPTLIKRVISDDIIKNDTRDYSLTIPDNTDVGRSMYSLSVSTNPLDQLESIISSLLVYPYGCVEQTTSTTLPNALAPKFAKYFGDAKIDLKKGKQATQAGLDRLKKMQMSDGGFGYWEGDTQSHITITPYVTRSLMQMRDAGANVDEKMITDALNYLKANMSQALEPIQKVEILYTLSLAKQGQSTLDSLFVGDPSSTFSRHELVMYTYGLVMTNRQKYAKIIDTNIEKIKVFLAKDDTYDYSWYWDRNSDTALFAGLLMSYDYDTSYIYSLINDLSKLDYLGYYMSTQSKNTAFLAFLQFIEKYGRDTVADVEITLGDISYSPTLTGDGGRYVRNIPLSKIAKNDTVSLTVGNPSDTPVFVSVRINAYPLDTKKIEAYNNGMKVGRTLYEVVDTKKLAECSTYYYGEETKDCESAFKLVRGTTLKKGATYKVVLSTTLENERSRNLTLEDYLPATFRVLNSNFRTNSIATGQSTSNSWYFDHVENQPGLVMAHISFIWDRNATYEYFVIPELAGSYLYPPVNAYLMYNPDIRAYSTFETITVE